MAGLISSPPYSVISSTVIFSVGSPSPTFSPVNGFLVVGVVIVLFLVHFCLTRSSPGFKSGLNSRFLSNGISSVDVIGSPSTGPYFVTSSTGGGLLRLYQDFNSWFTWNVLLASAFGSNSSLWPGLISSPPYSVISSTGCFVIFLLVHLRQPLLMGS